MSEEVATEKPKMLVAFKEHEPVEIAEGKFSKPPKVLHIGNGEYRREFRTEEQPFEVESGDELTLLLNTGLFEEVEEQPAEAEILDAAETPTTEPPAADAAVPTDEASTASKKKRPRAAAAEQGEATE